MTLDVGIPSFLSWLTAESVRDLLFLLPTSSRTEITSEHNHAQEFVFLLESFKHLDVTVLRNFYMSTLHPPPYSPGTFSCVTSPIFPKIHDLFYN